MRKYQLAVLKSVKHLKVTSALTAVKVGNVLPEAIHSSQGQ